MKVVLKITSEQFDEIKASWSAEHANYYGRPCGSRKSKHPDPFRQMYYGFGKVNTDDVCGGEAYQWYTSGGNLAKIWRNGDEILFVFEGVRHGTGGYCCPINLTECEVLYFKTTRPDVPWFQTC